MQARAQKPPTKKPIRRPPLQKNGAMNDHYKQYEEYNDSSRRINKIESPTDDEIHDPRNFKRKKRWGQYQIVRETSHF